MRLVLGLLCFAVLRAVAGKDAFTTVIVTYVDNLPISIGNSSGAPTPSLARNDIPGVRLVADLPLLGEAIYAGTSTLMDADDICDILTMSENIETCEPDSSVSLNDAKNPNDPLYPSQTYLNTTRTVDLWQQGIFGNKAIRIGVIDSGVDLTNPDMLPSLWTNPNESDNGKDNDNDGVPGDVHCASFLNGVASGNCQDENGQHATFVCGEIGAVTNNAIAVAGIVQQPTILPCQYIDATGNGQISDALLCFNWLATKNVQIISCSWGASSSSSSLQQAVSRLSQTGILISTSAGNNGVSTDTSPQYPSSYSATMSAVVAVAATDATGNLWARSNYGTSSVQLAAPGVSVTGLGLKNVSTVMSGTSMAAPMVTGVAALLMSQLQAAGFDLNNTNGIGQAVKSALISGSTPLPSSGKGIGGGLLSATGAWAALQKSDLYMQGPSRRPANTTGTSSVTTAVIYILIGFAIASIAFAVVLAVLLRARKRPPRPVDLTGINFRTAQNA